jgi:hypothetical protein
MGWDGPILTDSGGFQVFSLAGTRVLRDDGVEFSSVYDGSRHVFTPELAMRVQEGLGADIVMCLDECAPGTATRDELAAPPPRAPPRGVPHLMAFAQPPHRGPRAPVFFGPAVGRGGPSASGKDAGGDLLWGRGEVD